MSVSEFPGLKWSREKAAKMGENESFTVVRKYAVDSKTGEFKYKVDENDKQILINGKPVREKARLSQRTLTGIPKHLEKHPDDIYITEYGGVPYWITGSVEDVRDALNAAGVRNVDRVINSAITSENFGSFMHNGKKLLDYINDKKSSKRKERVDPNVLTNITPEILALLVRARNRAKIEDSDSAIERITRTGKVFKSSSLSTSPRREPMTPARLLKKANDCRNKEGKIPYKDYEGNWLLPGNPGYVPPKLALNIGKMTPDGKNTKSCYVPRDTNVNVGRKRARKLVHIDVPVSGDLSTNILVNVENASALENYIRFMGNMLTSQQVTEIKRQFNDGRQNLSILSSPRKKKNILRSPRKSPKERSPKKDSSGKKVVYIPRKFNIGQHSELVYEEDVGAGSGSEVSSSESSEPAQMVTATRTYAEAPTGGTPQTRTSQTRTSQTRTPQTRTPTRTSQTRTPQASGSQSKEQEDVSRKVGQQRPGLKARPRGVPVGSEGSEVGSEEVEQKRSVRRRGA